jgi:DNA polymerase-3 subunit epsilon
MEREIALDTETTGLSPLEGHRIIEIGCVEMMNRVATGNHFHVYVNPMRDVPESAVKIHGLTEDFLKDKPVFSDIADDFLKFIGNSKLVIHNADFDTRFLNAELFNIKKPEIIQDNVFCTLKYARKKFPGAANNLDALCRRFGIDNSHRDLHGALLDSEILAEVYLELMGGAQMGIDLGNQKRGEKESENMTSRNQIIRRDFAKRDFKVSDSELEEHNKLVNSIENSLWKKVN